ncbi:cytochrome P450 [Caulobacter segnis]
MGHDLPDSLMAFARAPQQFLLDLALSGSNPWFRMNDETFLVLSDPASIHAVMNGKLDDFEKGATGEIPRVSWRDGIITVDGEGWVEQHAMFAPQFARRRIRQLEPLIRERVCSLMETWAALPPGEPVDLLTAASRLAFDVVAIGLLGITDTALADDLFQTLGDLERVETVRITYLVKRMRATASASGFRRSAHSDVLERMDRLAMAVADERLARTAPSDDLLGGLMTTEVFQAYSAERQRAFLADQVVTLLAAGFVTTGESMFWGLYLLAKHPEAQARARAEVLAETDAASGTPPMDAPLFVTAAFNESQRLYPPVWFMGRVARRDVVVGETEIPADTRVICSPYVLHRMPDLWPDSDQYRPERFLPDAEPPIVPRSLIAFGTGMRACLGRAMALMEMSALACMTLARFELELVSDAPVSISAAYTIQPRDRVLFRIKPLAQA